ncbi:MAG: glycosyltransferase [Bacteroidales bacterium]|nr:glycosyltransferase [Bacteroidales bacterium]
MVKNGDEQIKVYINTNDFYKIEMEQYNWCDIYGNVNTRFTHYPKEKFPKQISLAPSFGIRNFNFFETAYYSVLNFFKAFDEIKNRTSWNKYVGQNEKKIVKNILRYFYEYLKNYLYRQPIESYKNTALLKKNYIFFLSTLWYNDENNRNDEGVNRRRANFIEAMKELENCEFEGGLLCSDRLSSSNLFEKSVTNTALNLSTWLQKTKESEVVFNTPAFWDCHGWKLGEYLAMGKAIISTPLSNDLPEPLIHGEHIHIIPDSSKESIKKAVIYILENPEYRVHLETNAQKYWNDYGEPKKALQLLGLEKS